MIPTHLHIYGVLHALGLHFDTKESHAIINPSLNPSFLKRNAISNVPRITIENFRCTLSEDFIVQRPNKEALMQLVLAHYTRGSMPKDIEAIVEAMYQHALRRVFYDEKALSTSFLLSVNENLAHLRECLRWEVCDD
jgi:hypothetical protein